MKRKRITKTATFQEIYDLRTHSLRRGWLCKEGYPVDEDGLPIYTITFTDYIQAHTPKEISKKYKVSIADANNMKLQCEHYRYKKLLDETKVAYKVEHVNFDDEEGMESSAIEYGMLRLPPECIERLKSINKKRRKNGF